MYNYTWETEAGIAWDGNLEILQFCAKFCANCHSANFSNAAVAGVRKDRDKHIVAELSEEEKKAGIEPQPRWSGGCWLSPGLFGPGNTLTQDGRTRALTDWTPLGCTRSWSQSYHYVHVVTININYITSDFCIKNWKIHRKQQQSLRNCWLNNPLWSYLNDH